MHSSKDGAVAHPEVSGGRAKVQNGAVAHPEVSGGRAKVQNGAVAQSVEQKTENLCVGGSIPSHTTFKS